jgi:hypothetical protein
MSETPNAYRECAREGCEEPVAHADPREKHRGMHLGGDEYCSLTCRNCRGPRNRPAGFEAFSGTQEDP